MGKALYRQYRPTSLDDVVGQEHVVATLKNALKGGTISHAYLLTGPRGVGKTTIARILAHEINGLSYNEDDAHLDIIEIDAASNRRIDDIRDLRDKVHIAPTSAKYKVYIIDEVHMLTGESFNALLKTLEEPPAHVVFILATTEAHKLPDTIVSRTQRFAFHPVDDEQVIARLRKIADEESVEVTDEALELIASHGEGGLRDSINLLDQARGQAGLVTAESVQRLLGIPPVELLDTLLAAAAQGDTAGTTQALHTMQLQGYDAARVAKQLAKILREQLVEKRLLLSPATTLTLLAKLLDIPAASQPYRLLELLFLEAALHVNSADGPDSHKVASATSSTTKDKNTPEPPAPKKPADKTGAESKKAPAAGKDKPAEKSGVPAEEKPIADATAIEPEPAKSIAVGSIDANVWPGVLDDIKKKYNTLYGIARMAGVDSTPTGLRLSLQFAFHQKRLSEPKNKAIIIAAIEQVTGVTATLECVVAETVIPASKSLPTNDIEPSTASKPAPAEEPAAAGINLANISNIFGGAEVLES